MTAHGSWGTTLAVALGGSVGAVLRYRIGLAIGPSTLPWATLLINLSGCFLLALLLGGPLSSRGDPVLVTALGVGVLGAYTTFSTFGWETVELVREGRVVLALAYVAASLLGGLGATAVGFGLGRAI